MRASSTRRKITYLKVGFLLAVVVVFGAAMYLVLPGLRERNFRPHFNEMRVIDKPDFYRIYCEADDPWGAEVEEVVAVFLDNLYAEWGGPDRLDLRPAGGQGFPIVILLFRDERRLQAYHGERYRRQDIRYNAGMYEQVAGTISLVSDRRPRSPELRRGLYHEMTHMVLHRLAAGREQEWSRWLNEGLATYLERSGWEPGVGFRLGGPSPRHLRYLDLAPEPWRLREILTLDAESFTGAENARAYALSSVFVSFLLEADASAWEERFWRYVNFERAPGPVGRSAFRRAFGVSVDELEPAVRKFISDRLLGR